jgi:hypothetical protein
MTSIFLQQPASITGLSVELALFLIPDVPVKRAHEKHVAALLGMYALCGWCARRE